MGDLVKKLGEEMLVAVKAALIPALKPLLKQFSQDVIALVKAEAEKTPTPIDNMVVSAAEPMVEKLIDDLLAKV